MKTNGALGLGTRIGYEMGVIVGSGVLKSDLSNEHVTSGPGDWGWEGQGLGDRQGWWWPGELRAGRAWVRIGGTGTVVGG